jgi:hypothetical protein
VSNLPLTPEQRSVPIQPANVLFTLAGVALVIAVLAPATFWSMVLRPDKYLRRAS